MARLLTNKGYKDVWPLAGGFDAWMELGYPVEAVIPEQADLASLEPASPTA